MRDRLSAVVFVSLCSVWGSTWLTIRVGLRSLPPFIFAGLSFATSTIILLLIVKFRHRQFPRDRSSWLIMIFLGLTMMGAGFAFQYWGQQYVPSGLAALLFATCPLFVAIFASTLIKQERITEWKAFGILISFAGLVVIFWPELTHLFSSDTQGLLYGALAEVASGATTALAIVVYKQFCAEIDRVINLSVQTIVGSVFLLSLGLIWERAYPLDFSSIAIVAVIYLGSATAIPYIGYYWLLERKSAVNVSTVTFITPILALVLGWIVLGEPVTENTILGGTLILAGVYIIVRHP